MRITLYEMRSVIMPQMKQESSRATAATAMFRFFFSRCLAGQRESVANQRLSAQCLCASYHCYADARLSQSSPTRRALRHADALSCPAIAALCNAHRQSTPIGAVAMLGLTHQRYSVAMPV